MNPVYGLNNNILATSEQNIFQRIRESAQAQQWKKSFALLERVCHDLPSGWQDFHLLKTRYLDLKRKEKVTRIKAEEVERLHDDTMQLVNWLEGLLLRGRRIHSPELMEFLTGESVFENVACPACASHDIEISEQNEIKCFHCNASEEYFIPSPIQPSENHKITVEESRTIEKLMLLCRHELILKNYQKALEHCEKALEIGFDLQEVWEYHALCYYYHTSNEVIIQQNAKQILADLKTSKNQIVEPYKDSKSIREIIAKGVAAAVKRQYNKVKNDESQRAHLIQLLRVWKSCYEIYPSDGFLKAILLELIGKGKFLWFALNLETYTITNHPALDATGFNALKELRNTLNLLFPNDHKIPEYTEIIQLEVARQFNLKTYNDYFFMLQNNDLHNNYYKSDRATDVQQVIDCILNWQRIHKINRNTAGIDIAIRELEGKGKICWFELDESGKAQERSMMNEMGFSPFTQLSQLSELKGMSTVNWKPVKKHICRFIQKENEEMAEELDFDSPQPSTETLEILEKICLNSYTCYLADDKNVTYFDLPLSILTNMNHQTVLFQLEHDDISDNYPIPSNHFSAVAWLKELCQLHNAPQWNMRQVISDIRETLKDFVFEGIMAEYQQAVQEINAQYIVQKHHIEAIIRCIENARKLLTISEDTAHLTWAVEEMSGLRGSSLAWVFKDKQGKVIPNSRIVALSGVDILTIWEGLLSQIQTYDDFYQPPVLKKAPLWSSVQKNLPLNGNFKFPRLK